MPAKALVLGFLLTLLCPLLNAQTAGGGFEREMKFLGDNSYDLFGLSLAALEDLDGDQIAELAVGGPGYDSGTTQDVGIVRVYSGAGGDLLWEISGSAYNDDFGLAMAPMDDRNGDGVPEVLVATGEAPDGKLRILSGMDGSFLDEILLPGSAHGRIRELATLADVNGDGVSDLVVGSSGADSNGLNNNGAVLVVSGASLAVLWQQEGDVDTAYLGTSVANAGDVNGDGYEDVLGGALWAEPNGISRAGSAFLYSGTDGQILYRWDGTMQDQRFGEVVSSAGDANGDGVLDCAVTALADAQGGGSWQGSVSVYSGADGQLIYKVFGSEDFADLGIALACAGDVDQDGKDDLWMASAEFNGRVHLYSGDSGYRLFSQEPESTYGSSYQDLGVEIVGLGDFNGDGNLNYFTSDPGVEYKGAAYLMSFRPFIQASTHTLSAASGGTVQYDLDFPGDWHLYPDLFYALLASGAGQGPTLLAGYWIPLTPDALYSQTLAGQYPAVVQNGAGALDADGNAVVTLSFPPGAASGLINQTFHLAAVSYEYAPWVTVFHGVSRPVTLTILP
ncbi:MAG: hypothetical protein DWQ01_02510 [Planctomycetota bacterium]|nr:MAG: hypothetical protein DWQ01_02510 [Planctomycetota bacterium]